MDPVKKYYEANLDGLEHFGFGDHHQRIIDMLSKEKKGKLLDIGCGNGFLANELKKIGYDTYGIDLSSQQVKRAKKRDVKAKQGSADEKFKFKDNFFDCVVVSEVIEHLFEPENCLRECYRVLKKGGILIVGIPNTSSLQARLAMFFLGESQFVTYPYVTHPHIRMFSKASLIKLLKKHNFKPQKTRGANWFMFQYTRKNAQIIKNNKPVEYNWNSWLKILFWIKYNIFSHFPILSQTIIVKSVKN
ncbi:MAG: class I SAM-dependent methyltransferase [Candidatus Aenigmarchaeota archaeon]|nr:class I SAM-dependent methyltransferase [Candidatus Aenigmarchaeota archaeon]